MGKETTKTVREETMPMIECQKQNALHKGVKGINISHNRESIMMSVERMIGRKVITSG
jgi:hypothetical protein